MYRRTLLIVIAMGVIAAETPEQFDLAQRKMDIFCND